ncbi:MAG: GTP cyclohydrolase II [Rhodospirillales bacterium]|nr:GTP cyclohydrolase II [Rhodospirillales bacterium]
MALRDDTSLDGAAAAVAGDVASSPETAARRLRAVHRAAAELKRGTPVLVTGAERGGDLVVVPAETCGASGLRDLAALAGAAPLLVLAPVRAAAVLSRPVVSGQAAAALRLSPLLLEPASLRGLADPTAAQLFPEPPVPAECPEGAAAALALTKLARLLPAVLVAPAVPEAAALAGGRGLLAVPCAEVLAYPAALAAGLARVAEAQVPLDGAPDARVVAFRAPDSGIEHLAIVIGRPEGAVAPLVRIHSECFTGDLLGSLRCDCGAQLRGAIQRMGEEGAGVLLYLAQEGRGIGLVNKLRAYALQDRGLDTVDANRALGWGADERNFLIAATMLDALGVGSVRLLTNNPDKVAALAACGVRVVAREPHAFAPNGVNDQYLATKAERFGHLLG